MSVGIVNEDVVYSGLNIFEWFWMFWNSYLESRVEKNILYNILFLNVLNAELGRVIQKSWFFMHEQDNLKILENLPDTFDTWYTTY